MTVQNFWKNYSLSIILGSLFLMSWIGQAISQWFEFTDQARAHNEEVQVNEYMHEFLSATFENWQSEFLQLFTFVVLATYFIHKNSPQSRDGDDKMREDIKEIKRQVEELAK